MRRVFFWFSFGLVVLIISSAVWLWTADLGLFKPQIEKWVSDKTGREFAIDGILTVDLARMTIVVAEDVRFANADWADKPQMVTVGRAEVHLDLRSIFSGPVVIDLIDVDDTSIHLAANEDGTRNWVLDIERRESRHSRDTAAGPPILLKKVDVDRVSAVLDSPRRLRPLRLQIESLDQNHREDDILELALYATLDDSPVIVRGEAGGWQNLLAASDIRFDVEGQLGTFEFTSEGWLDDLRQLSRPSFRFSAKGPHINDLLRTLGLEESGEGDIDLSGALTATGNEPLSLSVKGNLGRMQVEASGSFSDLQSLERVDIDLLASAPDLSRVLGLFGIHQLREAPFMVRVNASRNGSSLVVNEAEMVFAEAQFDLSANLPRFPSLDDSRIMLAINGPDVERFRFITGLPGQAKGPFSIDFDVEVSPDGVELLQLDLETSLGQVEANGQLGDAPDYIGSVLELTVRGEDLARLGSAYGVQLLPAEPFELRGSTVLTKDGMQTQGPLVGTVNEVRVALDGHFALQRGLLGSNFAFELEGPDLAILIGAFAAVEGVPDEPYDISGQLQVRGDGYRFREVAGTLGTSALKVDGLLVARGGINGSYFKFAVNGPAFEELIDEIGTLEVYPGRYALSGRFAIQEDRFTFGNIELDRERGDLTLDLDLGRPASRRWMQFDLRARGRDIRTLFAGYKRFEIAEAPFSIDVEAEQNGTDWSIDKVDIDIGDIAITASGDLEFGGAASRTRFRFNGKIPDLSTIGSIDGFRMRPQLFTLDAVVAGGGGELRLDDLNAKLGESDINGSFHYVAGDIPEISVKLESESLIFAPLLEERDFEYDPQPERSDGRMIPDITIPFEAMKKLNAAVEISVGELERDRLYMTNARLHADLRDGSLMIHDTGFNARSGYLSARASVEPGEPDGRVALAMIARDFALGMSELNLDMAMTGDIDVNLTSSGNDLRTLMGNASGVFVLDSRGGRVSSNRLLHVLYGDLLDEVISTVNPFYKSDPFTQFDCIVLPAQFVAGRVSGQPNAYFETDKMRIATKSEIDLKTERVDVAVRTSPQRGLGISAGELLNPFVKITGTLARPQLAVDEQGVLITGGAAVATGGLSILARGLWDRLTRESDACASTGAEARKLLGDQLPDFGPASAE